MLLCVCPCGMRGVTGAVMTCRVSVVVAVASYLASKGMDQKLMFWEGKGAKEPVPVTKFCE